MKKISTIKLEWKKREGVVEELKEIF